MSTMRICPKCMSAIPADAPEGTCPKCLMNAGFETQSDLGAPQGRFIPPEPTELAKHFPQLDILELLGAGGMGVVYKVRQITLDRIVALKILPPSLGNDPSFAERFSREARALAKLNHPNIVAIFDFGQASGFYFFLMEFVDGVNLRQMLAANRLAPREALAIVPQICDALQYAHDQGVVHRDIKPENLLIDRRGRVRIADFGLARLVGAAGGDMRLTHSQNIMGTPHYMAPEQFEKPLTVDHRADIYSLGVVFYEMLTGDLPLGRFAPPSQKVQIDVRLDEVVLKTLENDPGRRYQQASEVKSEVETIGGVPIANLPPNMRQMFGSEFVSKVKIGSWPLVHFAFGLDPKTGKQRVARGIIAFGNSATGFLAVGLMARGVIAFGGFAIGIFAFGGVGLGLLTFAGVGLGLLFCYGGIAIGTWAYGLIALGYGAFGGWAVGYYAMGYSAHGMHVVSDRIKDPEAREFFRAWTFIFKPSFIAVIMAMAGAVQLTGMIAKIWVRRRTTAATTVTPKSAALPK